MASGNKFNKSETQCKKAFPQLDMDDSLALSNVLDMIGFSETNRQAMIGAQCIRETLRQISTSLRSTIHCVLPVGSLAEGTTHYGMNPDEDVLMFIPAMYVYKYKQKRAFCHMNTHLIMLKDPNIPSGYTKLQIVKNRKIFSPKHILPNSQPHEFIYEKLVTDLNSTHVLSNKLLKMTDIIIDERNGPAETNLRKNKYNMYTDFVRAYYCNFIPDIAKPWFHHSHSNLASTTTINTLSQLGCFVVPVGCPTSDEKELEWRISLSFQEKYIMLNLNMTQYKCYIMLKLIKKYIIEPRVGKCISSYHCKTALFYTIDGYCVSRWLEDNLMSCVIECLKLISTWIENGFCPNYFIPEENMFVGKLNVNNQISLKVLFAKMINESSLISDKMTDVVEVLYHATNTRTLAINVHSEIERVGNKFTKDPSLLSILGHPNPVYTLTELFGFDISISLGKDIYTLGKILVSKKLEVALDYINCVVAYLKCETDTREYMPMPMTMRYIFFSKECTPIIDGNYWSNVALSAQPFYNTDNEKLLIPKALSLASGQIHSLLASVMLAIILTNGSTKLNMVAVIENYDKGKSVNYFANRLKQLSLFYNKKQYEHCFTIFKDLLHRQYVTIFKCICSAPAQIRTNEFVSPLNDSIETILSIAKESMCCCVVFDIYELEAAIPPLFHEAFRSFAAPKGSRFDINDYWFDRAIIDPVIYLNFMLMKCAYELDDMSVVAKALGDIEQTIVRHLPDRDFAHLETALNVLGHCYLNKGWSRLALQSYKVSWAIRPLHNAAKWHVAFLMFGNSCC